jgi:hypothetical protein
VWAGCVDYARHLEIIDARKLHNSERITPLKAVLEIFRVLAARGYTLITSYPPIFPAKNSETQELEVRNMASYLSIFRIAKLEGDPLSRGKTRFCAESAGWWKFGLGGGLTAFLNRSRRVLRPSRTRVSSKARSTAPLKPNDGA